MSKARDIANLGDSLINDADDNVALGDGALDSQTTGANNVAIGESALNLLTTGSKNTAIGRNALQSSTTGNDNVAMGENAGGGITTATDGTFLGRGAGASHTSGNASTYVGRFAGASTTGQSSSVFISAGGTSNGSVAFSGNSNGRSTVGFGTIYDGGSSGQAAPISQRRVFTGNNDGNGTHTLLSLSSSEIPLGGVIYCAAFKSSEGASRVKTFSTIYAARDQDTQSFIQRSSDSIDVDVSISNAIVTFNLVLANFTAAPTWVVVIDTLANNVFNTQQGWI